MGLEALENKWNSKVIMGDLKPEIPKMIAFNNTVGALEMLHSHLLRKSRIAVHCDVDMDGIGCGYILKRMLSNLVDFNQAYFINKEKEHGIMPRHVEYFEKLGIDLLIIVDSSSNEIDTIKKFNCDVLVIDHHEIGHTEFNGFTNDGEHRFIIVNNIISNSKNEEINEWIKKNNPNTSVKLDEYVADSRMSCGLVLYELLRIYQEAYSTGPILENTMLYQWAGVTLFTDAIQLANERNQWYIQNTVHSMSVEPTLMTLMKTLNRFSTTLSKSLINYTIAPTVNKAIRAGASGEALVAILNNPSKIIELQKYKEYQDRAISAGTQDVQEFDSFVLKDLTETSVSSNYSGVIAGKLCDDYKKNAVVYKVTNGIAQGSFRGRTSGADYRKQFESYKDGVYAQGHAQAFGFKADVNELPNIMETLTSVESGVTTQYYLTAGDVPPELKGIYHIDDMDNFKKLGGIMRLAVGNSNVSSDEQIMITVPSNLATLEETKGKLFIYTVLGLSCKAFNQVNGGMINIYPEFTNSIELFIK